MQNMKQLLTIAFVIIQFHLIAKPVTYNITKIIGSADYVDEVVISKYSDGDIYFQSINYKDTVNKARCGSHITSGVEIARYFTIESIRWIPAPE